MLQERSTVLLAVSEIALRRDAAETLIAAGFDVWQACDYDEAIAVLHASPRRLIVLVSPELRPVLVFAANDRRLAHHHVYVALGGSQDNDALCERFGTLTVWTLAESTPTAVMDAAARAARMLGASGPEVRSVIAR